MTRVTLTRVTTTRTAGWLVAALIPVLVSAPVGAAAPFDSAFWTTWGDGRAEIASYELVYPRYGELRRGTAVTVFVTEGFSRSRRVKSDAPAGDDDIMPVMKLNLVIDFPTGIYDYNLMTSTFVGLEPVANRPSGSPLKVSFSSQEWCGHTYQQLLPDAKGARLSSHSYFDGEADRELTVEYPEGGVLQDAMWHWARGFAAPFLTPGESREVQLLSSATTQRLGHEPPTWRPATLSRGKATTVDIGGASFEVEERRVEVPGHESWTFLVEVAAPQRIVRWTTSTGQAATLVQSERLRYWEMNRVRDEASVERIGLSPRPAKAM